MRLRDVAAARWKVSVLIAGATALFLIPRWVSSQQGEKETGANWFAKPYVLPRDVFDLSAFDPYRHNGKLILPDAQSWLSKQSEDDLPAAQRLFDITAWKAFVALNWPAKPDGEADASKGFTDVDTPRVWEYWIPTVKVFLPDGSKPRPWGGLSSVTADHFKAGWRQSTTVDQGKQAFSGPLIDQNGHWVHYVSLMNRREYDYVVEHELYNLEGQADFVRNYPIEFPHDDDTHYGAIEIKLAWKFLTSAEIKSNRFLVRKLPVVMYRPSIGSETPAPAHKTGRTADNYPASPTLLEETVGLIGMHIAMRNSFISPMDMGYV